MGEREDAGARRARIARGVWAVMSEGGLSAVSIRSVAAAAGVSAGSLQHVFRTREELLVHSARLMVDRVVERIAAEPVTDDPLDTAMRLVAHLLPVTPDRRVEMDVDVAMIAEARALPGLQELRDEAHLRLAEGCRRIVGRVNPALDDTALARRGARLHALIDGLGFHLLHRDPDDDPGWALALVASELEELRLAGS